MPGADTGTGRDAMDVLRGLIGEWRAGRDEREVARAASDALDDVCARVARVRALHPGIELDLGEDVHALIRLRDRLRGRKPLAGGLRRAASLL